MFIRPCYRRKNGKNHAYWALVESYRTERGPRQRVVSYLGQLRESERFGIQQAANGNKTSAFKQLYLFDTDNKFVVYVGGTGLFEWQHDVPIG